MRLSQLAGEIDGVLCTLLDIDARGVVGCTGAPQCNAKTVCLRQKYLRLAYITIQPTSVDTELHCVAASVACSRIGCINSASF